MQALDGLWVQAAFAWLGSASHSCQVLSWSTYQLQRGPWRIIICVPGADCCRPQDTILVQAPLLLHYFILVELEALRATLLRTWVLLSVARDGIGGARYKSCDLPAVKVLPRL